MKALARQFVFGSLAFAIFLSIPNLDRWGIVAPVPSWPILGAGALAMALMFLQIVFTPNRWHGRLRGNDPLEARKRERRLIVLEEAPILWVRPLVLVTYLGVLSVAGNHLGWSLQQAGTVGMLLIFFTQFICGCWVVLEARWR